MKYLKFLVFSILLINIGVVKVNAYTKEDILSLANSFEFCSTKTSVLVKGATASYSRMLNEREVSPTDLGKIYNNLNTALDILNRYQVCSVDDKKNIPSSVLSNLYTLYKQTNNIILSSPKITVGNTSSDSKVDSSSSSSSNIVIDSTNNQIKIYENGSLADVIETTNKLNYVGLNKIVIISIMAMTIVLVVLVILRLLKYKSILLTSFIYILVLALPITILFRNQISLVLDAIDSMSVKINESNKEIITKGEQIVSYPLYGTEYAQIYINDIKGEVYFGDSSSILKKGVGQKSSSYLPGEGKTTILSGHNTGVFKELSSLKIDDVITIETVYGNFIYEVKNSEIVTETNVSILEKDYDLILYTCYPNYDLYGDQRIVVYANLKASEWFGDNYEK